MVRTGLSAVTAAAEARRSDLELRRADHHTFAAELRFHGESYGWEAMILRDGELLGSRRFVLRVEAEAWAGLERKAIEKDWD